MVTHPTFPPRHLPSQHPFLSFQPLWVRVPPILFCVGNLRWGYRLGVGIVIGVGASPAASFFFILSFVLSLICFPCCWRSCSLCCWFSSSFRFRLAVFLWGGSVSGWPRVSPAPSLFYHRCLGRGRDRLSDSGRDSDGDKGRRRETGTSPSARFFLFRRFFCGLFWWFSCSALRHGPG